jgi:hypothetical protein
LDLEKFGSADAVKAAKQKEDAERIRPRYEQEALAAEPPKKDRTAFNAEIKLNSTTVTEDEEELLAQQYAAKFLSENANRDFELEAEPDMHEFASQEEAAFTADSARLSSLTSNLTSTEKIQADNAAKSLLAGLNQFDAKQNSQGNNLPRVAELTDNFTDEDKRLQNFGKKGALSDDEKADFKRMQTAELQKKIGYNHGISKKMEAILEAEKTLRKARRGRIITYIGAVCGVLSGLIGLLLLKPDNLIITGFCFGQIIASLLLFIRVKFVKKITLFYSFVNLIILIFPGILGYQQNTEIPDLKVIFLYLGAIAAVFILLFFIMLSPAVKLYYDIDFREEKGKL